MITTEKISVDSFGEICNLLKFKGQDGNPFSIRYMRAVDSVNITAKNAFLYLVEGCGSLHFEGKIKNIYSYNAYYLPKKEKYNLESVSKTALRCLLIEKEITQELPISEPSLLIRDTVDGYSEFIEPGCRLAAHAEKIPFCVSDRTIESGQSAATRCFKTASTIFILEGYGDITSCGKKIQLFPGTVVNLPPSASGKITSVCGQTLTYVTIAH